MGYFAVLAQSVDKGVTKDLRVNRLHVNIWALRGLWFGRRLFHFDVGVELSLKDAANIDGIQAVEFLLPFRVEEGEWPNGAPVVQDLYEVVINDHSGPLIFGSPIHSNDSSDGKTRIEFEENQLTVVRIMESSVKAVPDYAPSADSSLYTVPLRHALNRGESVYFRLRWRVFGAAPLWKWDRRESGARVDFRVCDTRQGSASQRDPAFLSRVLSIDSANVFIMAPGQLAPTNMSPSPKHIRTLEPGAWTDYLKGAAKWKWMASDLLVYGWHRRSGENPVTEDDPFRVFLALNRPASRPWWLSIVFAAVGFVVASRFLSLTAYLPAISSSGIDVETIAAVIGIGSLMGLWALVQRLRPFLADRARGPRQCVRRIERWFLCR